MAPPRRPRNTWVKQLEQDKGSFRGRTRIGTPLPLLKCLKRIMYGTATHFQPQNAPDCSIFHRQCQNFSGWYTQLPQREGWPQNGQVPSVLKPRHQFPLGSPAFLLFLFYETTTEEDFGQISCVDLTAVRTEWGAPRPLAAGSRWQWWWWWW